MHRRPGLRILLTCVIVLSTGYFGFMAFDAAGLPFGVQIADARTGVIAPRPGEHYAAEERELIAHVAHAVGASLFALRAQDTEAQLSAARAEIEAGAADLAQTRAQLETAAAMLDEARALLQETQARGSTLLAALSRTGGG